MSAVYGIFHPALVEPIEIFLHRHDAQYKLASLRELTDTAETIPLVGPAVEAVVRPMVNALTISEIP